jgi:hypothetical protein
VTTENPKILILKEQGTVIELPCRGRFPLVEERMRMT